MKGHKLDIKDTLHVYNLKRWINFALPARHLLQQNPFEFQYWSSGQLPFSAPLTDIIYDWLIRICREHKIIWVKNVRGNDCGYAFISNMVNKPKAPFFFIIIWSDCVFIMKIKIGWMNGYVWTACSLQILIPIMSHERASWILWRYELCVQYKVTSLIGGGYFFRIMGKVVLHQEIFS